MVIRLRVWIPYRFLSRVSILTDDIDIAILSVRPSVCLSVRYIPVFHENGLTYRYNLINFYFSLSLSHYLD